jgi:hypothetical protein
VDGLFEPHYTFPLAVYIRLVLLSHGLLVQGWRGKDNDEGQDTGAGDINLEERGFVEREDVDKRQLSGYA